QILVLYPALVSSLITAIEGARDDGEIKVDFNLQINETPPCTTGFLPAEDRRSPADLTVPPLINDIYCKVPKDSQHTVRGARNLYRQQNRGAAGDLPEDAKLADILTNGVT